MNLKLNFLEKITVHNNSLKVNELSSLFSIASQLNHIDLTSTEIYNLETFLHPGLNPISFKIMYCDRISSTQFKYLKRFGNRLTELDLSSTQFDDMNDIPESVKSLTASNTNITNLFVLPPNLTMLDISSCSKIPPDQFRYLKENGMVLEELDLSFTSFNNMADIPESLTRLRANFANMTSLQSLSGNLRVLSLWKCLEIPPSQFQYLTRLENVLEELDISHTNFDNINYLPRSIRSLDISSTEISHLKHDLLELEVLDITNCKKLPKTDIDNIKYYFTKLVELKSDYESYFN